MEQHNDNTELDLKEIGQALWKRKYLIGLITAIAVVVSAIMSFIILTPKYEASAEILVNQAQTEEQFNQGDIRTNIELINTYSVIVKSPRILDLVIEEYDLNLTYKELEEKINVSSVRNSQVMSITVVDPDYSQAILIANAIATTFRDEVVQLMNIDNVHIMAEAKADAEPTKVSPKPLLNIAIAFVLGLMTSIGVVFLMEYLDHTIKTEQDIERELGIPVLASIAKMEEEDSIRGRRNTSKKATFEGGKQLEA